MLVGSPWESPYENSCFFTRGTWARSVAWKLVLSVVYDNLEINADWGGRLGVIKTSGVVTGFNGESKGCFLLGCVHVFF